MSEQVSHQPEFNWFRINVAAGLASFVVRAEDEIFAQLRLQEYCKSIPNLGVNPEASFDGLHEITLLGPDEANSYQAWAKNWPQDADEAHEFICGKHVHLEWVAMSQPYPLPKTEPSDGEWDPKLF